MKIRSLSSAIGMAILLLVHAPQCITAQSGSRLHRNAILVDTHNDFPSASIEKTAALDQDLKGKTHTDLQRLKDGGVDIQVFSIFCGPEQQKPYAWANREIDSVQAWAARNPSKILLVNNSADLQKAVREKKLGAMIGVEGGHMIEDRMENLDALYQRGVRYMTLTWNNSTSWASSAWDEELHPDSLPHAGLNDFGKSVVRRMNELGMIIDVSHVGEKTFWDAMAITTKPVIASHSCVKKICPHRRNLTDEQIKAIGKNGGVIHLNFYAGFLDSSFEKKRDAFLATHKSELDQLVAQKIQPDYAAMMVLEKYPEEMAAITPSIDVLLGHLDYIVALVGVDHVGMGSDFDGIEAPPRGLKGVEDFPKITEALRQRGYKKKAIRKILGGNFVRVLAANEE